MSKLMFHRRWPQVFQKELWNHPTYSQMMTRLPGMNTTTGGFTKGFAPCTEWHCFSFLALRRDAQLRSAAKCHRVQRPVKWWSETWLD